MQSRIAFGIQMHFVINFAANFFFSFHFFHIFHEVFQRCGTLFFKVLQNTCAPLYLADKGKLKKDDTLLKYSSQPLT